jgi:AcrR family transcriptional regulator
MNERNSAEQAPSTTKPKQVRRPRVSNEEAAERLIETTILMMREGPFTQLSVRNIAARADLNNSTIDRCFGSIEKLYMTAAHRLALGSLDRLPDTPDPGPFADPDLALSIRFRAWLLSNGADPAAFRVSKDDPLAEALAKRQLRLHEVSPLTAQTFTQLIVFVMQGYVVFNETHAINDEMRLNMLLMIYRIIDELPTLENSLGWAGRTAVELDPPAD